MPRVKVDSDSKVITINIWLLGSDPLIWRRLQVPGAMTLGELHDVIQIAMGWEDYHMHVFSKGGQEYGSAQAFGQIDESVLDEDAVCVRDVLSRKKSKCDYTYDFGDDWMHRIEVESIDPPEPGKRYPVCLAGERACPLEDSGGLWGYYDKLAAIQDPEHEEYEDYLEWFPEDFDPAYFNLDAVNRDFKRMQA